MATNQQGAMIMTITTARTGHIVHYDGYGKYYDALVQGAMTDRKVLVPYTVSGYGRTADLGADHNPTCSIGQYITYLADEGAPGTRVLRTGRTIE